MKDVVGYEGLYKVTLCGRVWSIRSNRFLKAHMDSSGYLQVSLTKDKHRKLTLLHRVVASSFIDNPDNLATVDHIDNNPLNNSVDNLQWLSAKDNMFKSRAKCYKFISPQGEFVTAYGLAKFARKMNLDASALCKVQKGILSQHKGWRKYDS